MQNTFRVRCILLRKTQWGESNLIVHGISSHGQRISGVARGAIKSKKRFAGGVLDPLQFVELVIKKAGKDTALYSIEEAQVIDDFQELRCSFEKIEAALWIAGIVDQFVQEAELFEGSEAHSGHVAHSHDESSGHFQKIDFGNKDLFNLCGNALRAIEKANVDSTESDQSNVLNKIKIQFGLKLLYHQGVLEARKWMSPYLESAIGNTVNVRSDEINDHFDQIETEIKNQTGKPIRNPFSPTC